MKRNSLPRPGLALPKLDGWSRIFLGISLLTALTQAGLILLNSANLPPLVPLFYSLPWGEVRLVSPVWLWLLPALTLLALVVNFITGLIFKETVLTRILAATSLLVAVMALLTLGKVILLGLP